jgi:hypothetical protein
MNRAALIEKLTEVQKIVRHLLAHLQASEHDKFAAHLYQSRREYRAAGELPGKGSKNIERCIISTFQSPRAWASGATFANGSTCCGLAIDNCGPLFAQRTGIEHRNA